MVIYACDAVVDGVCQNPQALEVYFMSSLMAESWPLIGAMALMICVAGGYGLISNFVSR